MQLSSLRRATAFSSWRRTLTLTSQHLTVNDFQTLCFAWLCSHLANIHLLTLVKSFSSQVHGSTNQRMAERGEWHEGHHLRTGNTPQRTTAALCTPFDQPGRALPSTFAARRGPTQFGRQVSMLLCSLVVVLLTSGHAPLRDSVALYLDGEVGNGQLRAECPAADPEM